MVFGETGNRGTPVAEAEQMIHRFLDAGGNFVDTADVYAGGRSEEIIGKVISSSIRDRLVVASKVRFPTDTKDPNAAGLSRKHMISSVENSLRRLNTDYLDIEYLHMWDPVTPLDETLRTMDDLIQQGKVRYFGISNFRSWQAMKIQARAAAIGIPLIAAQYQYSLVVRDIEYEVPGFCESEGLGIVPWGPLGGGFLSGKYSENKQPSQGRLAAASSTQEEAWNRRATAQNWRILNEVNKLAELYRSSTSQVALAWLLSRPQVDSIIIGARTAEQLQDNLSSLDLQLKRDDISRLDTVSRVPDLYPYRMIDGYGTRNFNEAY